MDPGVKQWKNDIWIGSVRVNGEGRGPSEFFELLSPGVAPMLDRWQFFLNRIGEQLWVKPLLMCLLSIAAAFLAAAADMLPSRLVPEVSAASVETLLKIISSSMLVIATFAVGSMVSAYASASRSATPRSFALIVADDVSQNALSTFIGAFIFSIVALVALLNGLYEKVGRFVIFALTLVVFAIVILTFVRWVDRIARLGRLETTIRFVESATLDAVETRRRKPNLGGIPVRPRDADALPVYGKQVGYVQRIEVDRLQKLAETSRMHIEVAALPGNLVRPGRELAFVVCEDAQATDVDLSAVARAFRIGAERTFDEDPRFGLVVLSEIASRALSPGVNDTGTAIQVIATLVRIFSVWGEAPEVDARESPRYDRVAIPGLSMHSMFDDAFRAIARDGAGQIEVVIHLLKALRALAECPAEQMGEVAGQQARAALARAEDALRVPEELVIARELAQFARLD